MGTLTCVSDFKSPESIFVDIVTSALVRKESKVLKEAAFVCKSETAAFARECKMISA